MFIGEYQHNIDEKGRLAVPAKFRKDLKVGAVVTKEVDDCLSLYPKTEWKKYADKIASLPTSKADARAFARLKLGSAMDLEVDNQGRMLIPEYLRKDAGLTKKAVIIGLYNRLEIWSEEKWQAYKNKTASSSSQIAESLG
ncbi:MAG: division/cell wall cluster transcriptional repressor MraZ, partial [Candidatus Buchananbacteria bacterium]